MSRSNRSRRGKGRASKWQAEPEPLDLDAIRLGSRHVERKRGRAYTVQPIRAERALKVYRCPGCGGDIAPGTPHLAVWAADDFFGDDHALADRRHWHTHCWKVS